LFLGIVSGVFGVTENWLSLLTASSPPHQFSQDIVLAFSIVFLISDPPLPGTVSFHVSFRWVRACMVANSIRTCTAFLHHDFLARYFLSFLGIVSFHFPLVAEKIEPFFPSEFNQLICLIKSVKIFEICLNFSLQQLYFTVRN
jgi:hypothetical protein